MRKDEYEKRRRLRELTCLNRRISEILQEARFIRNESLEAIAKTLLLPVEHLQQIEEKPVGSPMNKLAIVLDYYGPSIKIEIHLVIFNALVQFQSELI